MNKLRKSIQIRQLQMWKTKQNNIVEEEFKKNVAENIRKKIEIRIFNFRQKKATNKQTETSDQV